jgi:hypothetical protein
MFCLGVHPENPVPTYSVDCTLVYNKTKTAFTHEKTVGCTNENPN